MTTYRFTQGKTKGGRNRAHLVLEHKARLAENEKKSTPINMTNHSYFNLAGHGYENGVMDHLVSINADAFTPSNERSIPTKEVL